MFFLLLSQLKEQLSSCIAILEDALLLTEDLELPCPIDPVIPGKTEDTHTFPVTDTNQTTPDKEAGQTPPEKTDSATPDKQHAGQTPPDKTDTDSEKATTGESDKQGDQPPPETVKTTDSTPGKAEKKLGDTPPGKADGSYVITSKDEPKKKEIANDDNMSSCVSIMVNIKELVAQVTFIMPL